MVPRRRVKALLWIYCAALAAALVGSWRLAAVTDHLYARLVKDPERVSPAGVGIVSPADGTVLYVRRYRDGEVPVVVKNRTPIPVSEFTRLEGTARSGILIGIYMNTYGVHVNRAPIEGCVLERHWFNGPHLVMSAVERRVILAALLPNLTTLRKLLGLAPYRIYRDADYVTRSARETLVIQGARRCYVVRIADYYVGRILTWVHAGQALAKGQRLGMITWGSQTDLLIETADPDAWNVPVREGDYVYGGQTVVAIPRPGA